MATTEFVPNQAATEAVTAHVLWITVGLSCEGDSVAMTSATNPSLEDIITGAIPGMPRVVIHNQVIAYEVGQEFIQAWFDAEAGEPYAVKQTFEHPTVPPDGWIRVGPARLGPQLARGDLGRRTAIDRRNHD